ncbi:MAG: ornithine cyclodeaminase family protein [Planctomycetota bacterium]
MPMLIKKEQITKVLTMADVVKIMETTFRFHGLGKIQQPPKSYLIFQHGDMRSMPSHISAPTMEIAGIKCVTVHPNNRKLGLPTVMATILLIDPKTGYNIAVMDGTLITDMRTGAAGALAAKYLSKKNSKVAGFVGAGRQAYTQMEALKIVRNIKVVKIYDLNLQTVKTFAQWIKKNYPDINVLTAKSVSDAVNQCDIVVTTTPARGPIVMAKDVSPGTHINAIGADAPGKQELEDKLTKKCKIVIDEWEQASHSGEINVPFAKGVITKNDIYGELGKIVAKLQKGRTNNNEITIFDSTGLACQDIATAYTVYKKLKGKAVEVKFF